MTSLVKRFFQKIANVFYAPRVIPVTKDSDLYEAVTKEATKINDARLVSLEKLVFHLISRVDAQTQAINKHTETLVQYNTLFEELMNMLDSNGAQSQPPQRHSVQGEQNFSSNGDSSPKKRHLN